MIELLMSKGAKLDVRDKEGSTPLHYAAVNGHKEAEASLLDYGADVNALSVNVGTPLMIAILKNCLPVIDLLLLRGADTNDLDLSGVSALLTAGTLGHLDIIQRLVDG